MTPDEYNRFCGWLSDPNRNPPDIAFTSGALRNAATAVQHSGVFDRIAELEAENARLRTALRDAIRRPLGIVPMSAKGLLTEEPADA